MRPDELAELRQRFLAASHGPVTIRTPLPYRVRLRLWWASRINALGIWLVHHGHIEAAVRLWRICGMW